MSSTVFKSPEDLDRQAVLEGLDPLPTSGLVRLMHHLLDGHPILLDGQVLSDGVV